MSETPSVRFSIREMCKSMRAVTGAHALCAAPDAAGVLPPHASLVGEPAEKGVFSNLGHCALSSVPRLVLYKPPRLSPPTRTGLRAHQASRSPASSISDYNPVKINSAAVWGAAVLAANTQQKHT